MVNILIVVSVIVVILFLALRYRGSLFARTAGMDWVALFNKNEIDEFIGLVKQYFEERSIEYKFVGGVVHLVKDDVRCGLDNLAKKCRQSGQNMWKEIIAYHFDSLFRMQEEFAEFEKAIGDYHYATDFLAVRIHPIEYLKQARENSTIHRQDIDGTVSLLVFDREESMMSASQDYLKEWNKSIDEVFQEGLENVRKKYPSEIEELQLKDDVTVKILGGDNPYGATNLFFLDEYPECHGKHGALVMVPDREAVICYPINDVKMIEVVNIFQEFAHKVFNESPYAITPNVYWYNEKKFLNLPYTIEKKKLIFFAPPEFQKLLEVLVKEEAIEAGDKSP